MKAILFILATLCLSCSSDGFTQNQPPTCDECVFEQTPKNVSWHLTVPADTARGQRIRISGTVFQSDGKTPAAGVLLYGYHTNAAGRYAKIGTEDRRSHAWWHGYLRGWLKTDANGRYEINTIKPAPYPGGTEPAHIHAMVKAPNQTESYWIHDFLFKGDPFLTDTYWYRSEMVSGNLRYEGITLKARSSGVQEGTRNIVLHPHYDRDGQNSGLLVGENCPAFDPTHVWGPDKGSRTCPMCKYGARTGGVMAWLGDDDWANAGKLALFLEKEIQQRGSQRFKGFLIYTNPKNRLKADVEKQLQAFAEQYHLREVSVVHVPSVDDKKTSFLYSINPRSENTIMVYHRRRVAEKFVNFSATEANLQRILAVVNKTMQ